jgi:hypothetical protein
MAQYQSSLGQVGAIKQSAVGTPGTITNTAPTRWMKLRSSSVGADRNLLIPDPEIGGAGARDVPKVYLGPTVFSGDYEFYVRSEALPLYVLAALGAAEPTVTQPGGAATPTSTTGYQHIYLPGDTLPALTIEEAIGNTFDTMVYTDSFVNTLHLECAADGYYMGRVGIVAIGGTAGNTPTATPGFDATPLIVGSKITVTVGGSYSTATNTVTGGAAFPAQSFSADLNNNIESNHFVLGSLFVDAMTPKRRDITGNLALRPQTNSYFRQSVFGTSGTQTSITGLTVVTNINISATTYEVISGAATNVYNVTINVPEAILAPHKVNPNQDNTIEESFDFRGVKVSGSNAMSVVVSNGVSAQY